MKTVVAAVVVITVVGSINGAVFGMSLLQWLFLIPFLLACGIVVGLMWAAALSMRSSRDQSRR